MNRTYETLAREAYRNSLELLDDAKLLFKESKYPRAYSLAVLSTEEFSKAFLSKSCSSGVVSEAYFNKLVLKNHKTKHFHFARIIISGYLFLNFYSEAIAHDIRTNDHAQHLVPKVKPDFSSVLPVAHTLVCADDMKQKGLYVGLREGKLVTPSDSIKKEDCEEIFKMLNFIYGFEVILGESDDKFRKTSEWIDFVYDYFEDYLKRSKVARETS